MQSTGDQQLVKRINRSVLLRLLRGQGGLSRAQLAQASGLTKTTVSQLVRELIDEAWLSETDSSAAQGPGRPSTPLHLDDQRRALIGVELAVQVLRVVAVSLTGRVIRLLEEPLADTTPEAVCQQAAALVARILQEIRPLKVQITGLGLGLPGAFDQASGILRVAPNMGWRNIAIVPLFRQALMAAGVPPLELHVRNEADAAALSEYEFTGMSAQDSLLFVTCDVGVGAGIVLNDRLFSGAQGSAGEVGHSVLQMDGLPCSCGRRGCAETFFGAHALARLAQPAAGGHYLGVLLQNLWTLFNPSVLVVGGASCERYPGLLEAAQQTLQAYADSSGMEAPAVRSAHYGRLASAVGAAALVLHHELRPMYQRAPRQQPTPALRVDPAFSVAAPEATAFAN
jgi:predicted NBD/HSP70 family sugar kinase/DNA-binding XRE family transcriptional regulator